MSPRAACTGSKSAPGPREQSLSSGQTRWTRRTPQRLRRALGRSAHRMISLLCSVLRGWQTPTETRCRSSPGVRWAAHKGWGGSDAAVLTLERDLRAEPEEDGATEDANPPRRG